MEPMMAPSAAVVIRDDDDDDARLADEAALREELELAVAEADAGETEDFSKALAELRAKASSSH